MVLEKSGKRFDFTFFCTQLKRSEGEGMKAKEMGRLVGRLVHIFMGMGMFLLGRREDERNGRERICGY